MKRVLVTGATGFIGRHSLEPLSQQGFEVHAVTLDGVQAGDAVWHEADLMNSASLTALMAEVKPTHLLHFAWYAVPGKYWTSLENFRWVRASLALLQAFQDNSGQRVVCAGTCAEYDWSYGYCSEALTPCHPATTYGRCKSAMCALTETFAKQAGLSAAWGRIFHLYGPFEPPTRLVSSVIGSLLKGQPALTTHGKQIRDFLHVQDVADAFVALLESGVSGAVNIASGTPVTQKEVVARIAEIVERPDLVKLGAIEASTNDPPLLVADTHRLSEEVGWTPHYDLITGLHQTVEWWKQELPLLPI